MAEWKPFDLKWGRSIWYCSACEESTEVPTYLGTPMYNFCPMCGANMNMKSENKQVDTPQTKARYCNECRWFRNKQVCGRCRSRNLFAEADTQQTQEFKNFDREDLILLIECQKERIGELLADKDTPQPDCPWK